MDGTGTVECITVAMSEPAFSDIMFDSSFCCYSHTATPLYVTLAYNFTGGNLWRWVRDQLGEAEQREAEARGVDVYEVLSERCSRTPTALFVLPHFTSTGTPYFDTRARGAILGLTIETQRAELLRAFLEGITWEMKLCLELQQEAGVRIDRLRATGGGAKSPFWLQLKADMWDKPVEGMDVSEASCYGVALCAGQAVGAFSSAAEASEQMVRPVHIYEPQADNARYYRERFEIYKEIYPALKDLNHRM
jgi:xylulokinase